MDIASYLEDVRRRDWRTGAAGTVRFAMLGIGWWVTDFAIPAVEDSELCETTTLVSSSREKARRVADEHGIANGVTYDEFQDGAAVEDYDAIYICTPNALHLPYVETAAEYDKAVLCEKPMESTVERAERLVEAGRDVPVMVAYRMHTEPAVRRARELVRDGFVGEPRHAHGQMSQRLLEMIPDTDQWRLNPDLAGPGTSVTDIGIYPLNTTRFVCDADPVAVQASMRSPGEGFERVPDEQAAFQVEYAGGLLGSFSASQNAYRTGFLRITGTEGEVEVAPTFHGPADRELTVRHGGTEATLAFDAVDQMREEFTYFADRVLGDGEIHADAEHGLVDMRAIEATYEAAERSERVAL